MHTTTSADGTSIAYDRFGDGPPLVLVAPAMHDRAGLDSLARVLAARFTVFNYDRRGRGDSEDTPPYAVEREIEDVAAMIAAAGGSAFLWGYSSGAVLAFEAAAAGSDVPRLALFEPPYVGSDPELVQRYGELIDAGDRAGALELFHRSIGVPEEILTGLSQSPNWPAMLEMAPTMRYDFAVTGRDGGLVPTERMATVHTPTLVIDSASSADSLRDAARATAAALPAGTHRSLPGEWHSVPDAVMAAALEEFFGC